MGEHNHKCLRSETEHAYKTCFVGTSHLGAATAFARGDSSPTRIETLDYRCVMKSSESLFKRSLPCPVSLDFSRARAGDYANRVRPASVTDLERGATGDLVVLYDGRPNPLPVQSELFEQTRHRAYESWKVLIPKPDDTFDSAIRQRQDEYMQLVAAMAPAKDG
jgi:hypothetical protein